MVRVKQRLESLRSTHISIAEYSTICEAEGVNDQESQDNLVDFLHDLGTVLHFRDLALLDTHVLEPRWVTGAVYRLITSETLAKQRGVLHTHQIGSILRTPGPDGYRYPKDKHAYIIEIMLKFELCYRLNRDALLIPDLLDVQEPKLKFDFSHCLRFAFKYGYLPRSVMPRLIVRMNADIKGDKRWRTGVELQDRLSSSTAVVRADYKANRIDVFVSGERKRDYFSVVRNVLSEINGTFEKLLVAEWVPLPDQSDIEVEYAELLGHEVAHREDIFIGKLGRAYSVRELLNGLEEEKKRWERASSSVVLVQGNYIEQAVSAQTAIANHIKATENQEQKMNSGYHPHTWERILAYITACSFVILIGYLAVRNQKVADPNLVAFIRILLSLFTAVLGAVVPGMLKVDFSRKGLAIRATGALALFVLTFVMSPSVLR